ncbi:MAG: Phosphomannomutase [Tremellales sp. Tagirdzhanova-0007]|nr:MAG: Phosphomannomutase [Tremellales sp. Tagirdzhanova-0007]
MATTTPANVFPSGIKPFKERKLPKLICMFDVDGTLNPARQAATPEMISILKKLRGYTATAFVSGSDLKKIEEQLNTGDQSVLELFDYCLSENGLTAYKLGKQLPAASFIKEVGEEQYQKLVNFLLRYMSEIDLPIKRGTFIEFRTGMINVSPVGRNASNAERNQFEQYDNVRKRTFRRTPPPPMLPAIFRGTAEHHIRATMIEAVKKEFPHLKMTYSIGGQISFDVFPEGWDKRYSLRHVQDEGFDEIHFFGDKTEKGGNDYELYADDRTIGHSVKDPSDTMKQIQELFFDRAK